MSVEVDRKKAKRQINIGLAIMVVVGLYILAASVYGIHEHAVNTGATWIEHGMKIAYQYTQLPVLSVIWETAPRPDFAVPLQLQNLKFLGLILLLAFGAFMRMSGKMTLQRIAKAQSDAQEESWKEEFKSRKK